MVKNKWCFADPPMVKQSSQGEPAAKGVTEAAVWDAWVSCSIVALLTLKDGEFISFLLLFQHKSPARRKYSFGSTNSQCSDDDNDSDVGSISSERSYGSRGSRNHHKVLEPGNVSHWLYLNEHPVCFAA